MEDEADVARTDNLEAWDDLVGMQHAILTEKQAARAVVVVTEVRVQTDQVR